MEDTQKIQLFEKLPIPKAVMTLAVPTVLSSLVTMIYNLADTYFVAMLDDPVQNAAVTLAYPLLLAFIAFTNLFGIGSSSMMSRGLGRKDYETVKKSAAFGFYAALFCSLCYSALYLLLQDPLLSLLGADEITVGPTADYLFWTVGLGAAPSILNVVLAQMVRAEGASLHASVGTMSGCILNILLDPLFILPFGLDMGAAGAGLATFISNGVACLYFFILLFCKRRSTYVCLNPKKFSFDREIVAGICGVGIPAMIQNLLNVSGTVVLNNFTAGFGADAVAAMGIVNKINMVPFQIAMGLSHGVMPLVSYNYAAGKITRMKKAFWFALRIAMIFLVLVMTGCLVGAGGLMQLFIKTPTVVDYGTDFLRLSSISLPFLCIDFMAIGVFQACGLGKKALVFAILRKIVLEIPALILLNRFYPLYGLCLAQPITELVLAVYAIFVLYRLFLELNAQYHGKDVSI